MPGITRKRRAQNLPQWIKRSSCMILQLLMLDVSLAREHPFGTLVIYAVKRSSGACAASVKMPMSRTV